MPTGFQHQQAVRNHGFFKPAPSPQHGQAADKTVTIKEPRVPTPRPGH